MYQIIKESKIEIIEKKSKFITRIENIHSEKEAKEIISEIIKKEKGAVHNCFAYRIIINGSNIIERKNDDGEPGGTAGAPMLAILTGEDMINTLVVTTRYFGGIKLGTGGLVSVYKKGVQEVLKKSGKKEYVKYLNYMINFPVNKTDLIQYELKKEKIIIKEKKFLANIVEFLIQVPDTAIDKLGRIEKLVDWKIYKI
jgi:uncharacterized YigZ family protein